MTTLGEYLKSVRLKNERSLRYAERKSKQLYPNDSDRQISNAYLYQVENGADVSVNPAKLKTLSEIYKIDYAYLLELAGYLSKPSAAITRSELVMRLSQLSPENLKKIDEIISMYLREQIGAETINADSKEE